MSAEAINELPLTEQDFSHMMQQLDNAIAVCSNKIDEGCGIWVERVGIYPVQVSMVYALDIWNITVSWLGNIYAQALESNCPAAWAKIDRDLIRGFYGETS